jgi:hypothetical protein
VSPTKGIDTVLTYIDGQYSGIDVEMMWARLRALTPDLVVGGKRVTLM